MERIQIGIIGGNGFIGNAIAKEFGKNEKYSVMPITRRDYNHIKTHKYLFKFDILINANGNGKKYKANNDPAWDFKESVLSVYNSIFDFKYKKYVFISSIDAEISVTQEHHESAYGFNKYIAEKIISHYCDNYSIVRCPSVIGKNTNRGITYDVQKGNKVYVTPDSFMMLIDVKEMAKFLVRFLESNRLEELERFYPSESITVKQMGTVLKKSVIYGNNLRHECYYFRGNRRIFKSSEKYLRDVYK